MAVEKPRVMGFVDLFMRLFGLHAEDPANMVADETLATSPTPPFVEKKSSGVSAMTEARCRCLAELSSDWYWAQDANQRFIDFSGRSLNSSAQATEPFVGKTHWEAGLRHLSESDRQAHQAVLDARLPFHDLEIRDNGADGQEFWVSVSGRPTYDEAGNFTGYHGIGKDITQRKQAEQFIYEHAIQQSLIAAFSEQALACVDIDSLLAQVVAVVTEGLSASFSQVLQLAPDGSTLTLKAGKGWGEEWMNRWSIAPTPGTQARCVLDATMPLLFDDLAHDVRFTPSEILTAHGIASGVEVAIGGRDELFGILGVYSCEKLRFSVDGAYFVQSVANILETTVLRKRTDEKLLYLAQFDTVTGLPNRNLFLDRLMQLVTQSRRNNWLAGVMFVDLDRFKAVNDTFGHHIGDKLLKLVSRRLQDCVRPGDTVARLGSDEFGIALFQLAKADDANLVANKVIVAMESPFDLDGHETFMTASIGISLFPVDGEDQDVLLKNADTAMYRAKELGRNTYQFYLPKMNERAAEHLLLETQLRGALGRGEFVLYYQPKVSLVNGEICGFEALLRWQHPERGLVPPLEFISVLEDTGLIVPVGEWVIRSACEQLLRWQTQGVPPRPIAVNLSARQFHQKDIDTVIGNILWESGVNPRLLEFELTESLLMSDASEAIQTLQALRAFEVGLSVDDFGTGYSSLAYLKRFPLDVLKIDRAFINDCATNPDDAAIAMAIINLAHSLKLKVVAEGVETEAQLNFLRAHGCDEIQGYYFARPLPVAECTEALLSGKRLQGMEDKGASDVPLLLLVDDNEDEVELLRRVLSRGRYRIVTANGAKAAFEMLARHPFEIVISDQQMPGMNGVEFLSRVRTLYPNAMRIMVSVQESFDTVQGALNKAGIHKYLSKDLDPATLLAEVGEAYRKARQEPLEAPHPPPVVVGSTLL